MSKKHRKRGMGSIYRRGDSWYIAYYVDGKQFKERIGPIGLTTKGQAEQALKARLGEVVQGKFNIRKVKKGVPLLKLVSEYEAWIKDNQKGVAREKVALGKLVNFLGDIKVNEIASWDIEQYKSHRKERVKPSTINRELNVFRSMFNRAIDWGYMDTNPMKGVKKAKPLDGNEYERLPKYIPDKVFQRILDDSPSNLKPFILLARNTGMRVSEMLRLKWGDIDLDNGYLLVRESKNSTQRIVPINEVSKEVMKGLSRNTEQVFNYKSKDTVGNTWRKALRRLKLSDFRLHELRHTFITDLVTKGIDITTVMEITGHKDIRMLKRYSHPTLEHKINAVKVLNSVPNNPLTIPSEERPIKFINDAG